MIYEFVQYQLPLSDLERGYNRSILNNEIYGTWIDPIEEVAHDWLTYEEPEQYFCDVCGHCYDVDDPCEFH
tara:strand:- start:178 stop:390 length:213 start_codon:yes stop_codon:yes gene_type:complete